MVDQIFRLYDIRGKIGTELPIEEIKDLANAIAFYLKQKNPQLKTISVGADGRVHSPAIKQALCQALQESGLDVIYVGPCPTPIMYFSLFALPVDAGLMITASHNGPEYNGLKICLGKEAVWGDQIQEIKKLVAKKAKISSEMRGQYSEYNLIDDYVNWMAEHFSHLIGMKCAALIDCGNGATGYVMPALVKKMKWNNVSLLFPEVDGTYPNHEADPIVEKNMQALKEKLKMGHYDLGLGFDGDGDRMTPMTNEGELVSGDKLLSLFAQEILKDHPGSSVVFDIKCSSGLTELLAAWGAKPVMSPSGHSIIKNQIKMNNAALAGELSCHFFFNDRYFGYDDGIYSALRLFEMLLKNGKSLEELLTVFPQRFCTPEIRIAYPLEKVEGLLNAIKGYFKTKEAQLMTTDGIRVTLKKSWGLIRSSNTQPVICFRFESDTQSGLESIKHDFIEALSPLLSKELLQKELNTDVR